MILKQTIQIIHTNIRLQVQNRSRTKRHVATERSPHPIPVRSVFVTATVDKVLLEKAKTLLGSLGNVVTPAGLVPLNLMEVQIEGKVPFKNVLPTNVQHHAVLFINPNKPFKGKSTTYFVKTASQKSSIIRKILAAFKPKGAVLVFVNNHAEVPDMRTILEHNNFAVSTLATNVTIAERARGLKALKHSRHLQGTHILVSTEMAARGLDLPVLSMVINMDLPTNVVSYVHRAGRVGRLLPSEGKEDPTAQYCHAMTSGTVVSIVSPTELDTVTEYANQADVEISLKRLQYGEAVDINSADADRPIPAPTDY
ncbi:hypothetical protein SARC_00306 [Sphaeroforma arctica JP610]|uniref:RNA helicase n=1 Tax=Sphaeroforma arctica JP610 TaxID=667725 RepID=A0A0L0GFJ6_9EUKA|nr:hypothetical protein SARC_00306 [Sphaeroforma arctica JP610]KNC87606.1 hypothetical protein SARC_00306 [Sphaeroforma arctica JP610]|eukprot:XP_014161508.1 hypothetical protein SARC_00306 [Sphaeroforma arctica JP610]